jgi:hypothetical protein
MPSMPAGDLHCPHSTRGRWNERARIRTEKAGCRMHTLIHLLLFWLVISVWLAIEIGTGIKALNGDRIHEP